MAMAGSAPQARGDGGGAGGAPHPLLGKTQTYRFISGAASACLLQPCSPPPLPAQGGTGAKWHVAAGVSRLLPAKCGRDLAELRCLPVRSWGCSPEQSPPSFILQLLQPQPQGSMLFLAVVPQSRAPLCQVSV